MVCQYSAPAEKFRLHWRLVGLDHNLAIQPGTKVPEVGTLPLKIAVLQKLVTRLLRIPLDCLGLLLHLAEQCAGCGRIILVGGETRSKVGGKGYR